MEDKLTKPVKPDNFLFWAILSTILCCLPLGIVAMFYANKVDALWNAGQYAEANNALKTAKILTCISTGVGILGNIILMALMLILSFNNIEIW